MSLARAHTWSAGDLLKANDLNGEFNNILNNPISLISPTTGVINFNSQSHTNLTPTALSLSSGQLIIGASSGGTTLNIGTTGQVLSVTSSNTAPAWGVIPISGGLTSGTASTGTIFYVSSSGVLTPLGIGSVGQVLTVTSTLPAWATPTTPSAFDPESNAVFYEDFYGAHTSAVANVGAYNFMNTWGLFFGAGGLAIDSSDAPGLKGSVRITSQGGNQGICSFGSTASATASPAPFVHTTNHPTMKIGYMTATSGATAAQVFAGLSTVALQSTATGTNAIYFWSSDPTAQVKLVCHSGGTESITSGLGVTTTAFHKYSAVITSSQVDAYVDGVLTTSITTNIPAGPFGPQISVGTSVSSGGFYIDYFHITSTR